MTTTTIKKDQVQTWRRELALMMLELRSRGLHLGISNIQALELAAILCRWPSLQSFRMHSPRPR